MTTTSSYLFVYGTLREDAGHEMYHVPATLASFAGRATVRGELYSLGEYPGLVPRSDTTDRVTGELYQIKPGEVEGALRMLDGYEGLGEDDPPPHESRRELLPVEINEGRQVQAWAYVLNRPREGLRRISSGDCAEWQRSRGA